MEQKLKNFEETKLFMCGYYESRDELDHTDCWEKIAPQIILDDNVKVQYQQLTVDQTQVESLSSALLIDAGVELWKQLKSYYKNLESIDESVDVNQIFDTPVKNLIKNILDF